MPGSPFVALLPGAVAEIAPGDAGVQANAPVQAARLEICPFDTIEQSMLLAPHGKRYRLGGVGGIDA
jgi:hypothetical protein